MACACFFGCGKMKGFWYENHISAAFGVESIYHPLADQSRSSAFQDLLTRKDSLIKPGVQGVSRIKEVTALAERPFLSRVEEFR